MIFVPRPQPKAVVDVPCRSCRQMVRADRKRCPYCGVSFPARGQVPSSGFEWKTETEFFGYPLIHIATGYAAVGQFALGYYALGQIGLGKHFWGGGHHDPEVPEFFRRLLEKIGGPFSR
jgi:hypothetical protein